MKANKRDIKLEGMLRYLNFGTVCKNLEMWQSGGPRYPKKPLVAREV